MFVEKEKIYEDLLISKRNSNQIKEENLRYRTKILNLERQIAKYEKIVQELEHSGTFQVPVNLEQINENMLVLSLRKRIVELNEEMAKKEEEISVIKKTSKFTQHQLLEVENKKYFEELLRLKECLHNQEEKFHKTSM